MTGPSNSTGEVYAKAGAAENYGLRTGALGPVETLAQSVSAMAPSTSASLTIPLVFALAGQCHLVRLSAGHRSHAAGRLLRQPVCAPLRVAWIALHLHCKHAAASLRRHRRVGAAAGLSWHRRIGCGRSALLCESVFAAVFHWATPALPCLAVVCGVAGFIAYRDVKLSAELMLWIEVFSVSLILIVLAVLLFRFGFQFDLDQFRLKGVSISALGPALVLSMFSFVGFEAATTLGGEAREPLKTIPRAVLQCAILAGVFFMLCAYCEVLGFRGQSSKSE